VREGEVYENPVTGERMEVLHASPERLEIDFRIGSGGAVPLEHTHPEFDEAFTVLAGELTLRLDGQELVARPGERHVIERGVSHAWWNAGEEEVRILGEITPPGRFSEMIGTMFQLARDGETDDQGRPGLLQLALTVPEFEDTAQIAKPPRAVQRLVFGLLAPIARLRGKEPLRAYRHAA
jgi:quercetin dioxygenase-like cupin family protein